MLLTLGNYTPKGIIIILITWPRWSMWYLTAVVVIVMVYLHSKCHFQYIRVCICTRYHGGNCRILRWHHIQPCCSRTRQFLHHHRINNDSWPSNVRKPSCMLIQTYRFY